MSSWEDLITLPERPDDVVEMSWQLEELAKHLPPAYMEVLYLRYYLGYSVRDVATLLDIDAGLVKWRANKARRLASEILRGPAPRVRTVIQEDQEAPVQAVTQALEETQPQAHGSIDSISQTGR